VVLYDKRKNPKSKRIEYLAKTGSSAPTWIRRTELICGGHSEAVKLYERSKKSGFRQKREK